MVEQSAPTKFQHKLEHWPQPKWATTILWCAFDFYPSISEFEIKICSTENKAVTQEQELLKSERNGSDKYCSGGKGKRCSPAQRGTSDRVPVYCRVHLIYFNHARSILKRNVFKPFRIEAYSDFSDCSKGITLLMCRDWARSSTKELKKEFKCMLFCLCFHRSCL